VKLVRVNNDRGRTRTIAKSTVAAQRGPLVGDDVTIAGMIGGDVGDKKLPRNHGGDTLFAIQGTTTRAPTKGE
jgi:hypothetical protein